MGDVGEKVGAVAMPGIRLVEASIRWANSKGADSVILHVAPDNDAAYRLYLRFGFEQIGEVAYDPDDPCFMARLMKLDLTAEVDRDR